MNARETLRRIARGGVDRDLMQREVGPLEGTNMSLFNSVIPAWWAENMPGGTPPLLGTPSLAERVWVADRCIQMNAQQIASMPLEFHGNGTEPAWVSNPDPNLFPNGIGDAIHCIVDNTYRHGFSVQFVTDRYADGFPRTWTVLPSSAVNIRFEDGRRQYKLGETLLDPRDVVQIDRNPTTAAHGTSALSAYAQLAYGLLAAGNQAVSVQTGGVPVAVLKSQRKLNSTQAEALQAQWMRAVSRRNGAPPIIPPDLDFVQPLSFSPADLALLETAEWDARALATAYGVPCVLLNMALQGGLTYQNPGALGEMWWRFELRTTATRMANAFSAQMLPRGQWVSVRAEDTFAPLTEQSPADDEQLAARPAPTAAASPAQRPPTLTAVGG